MRRHRSPSASSRTIAVTGMVNGFPLRSSSRAETASADEAGNSRMRRSARRNRASAVGNSRLPVLGPRLQIVELGDRLDGSPKHRIGRDVGDAPAIAAAENRRPLSLREELLRDERDQRCLAGPADAQVADADDWLAQSAPRFGVALVPTPACPDSRAVKEIKQWV